MLITNNKGQGLIEYIILVALMGVATIGIVRLLQNTVDSRFADIAYAIQGRQRHATAETIQDSDYQKRDLSDFMNGAAATHD